jgi:1,4-alpha-glucan branching enzyme
MSMIRRKKAPTGVNVTFVLDQDASPGTVSVVGDFNDWTPGAHVLKKRSNGTRSISITLPVGHRTHFRYLGENGHWFDDEQVDGHDAQGAYLVP